MQRPHLPSLAIGVASGALLLFIVVGGVNLLTVGGPRFGQAPQAGGQNLGRMAERLGMSEEDLKKELDSGKTMRELMEQNGGPPGGRGSGSGALRASGTTLSSPSSLSSSSGSVSS